MMVFVAVAHDDRCASSRVARSNRTGLAKIDLLSLCEENNDPSGKIDPHVAIDTPN